MTLENRHQQFISRPEVQFWGPIIMNVIALSAAYFGLRNEVGLIKKDISTLTEKFDDRKQYTDPIIGEFHAFKLDAEKKFSILGERFSLKW